MKDMLLTPDVLSVPNHGINHLHADQLAFCMNQLLADVFVLYMMTKNFHWHLHGPRFRDLHLLFDEQADQLFAMTDTIAERVRKIGCVTLRSLGEVCKTAELTEDERVAPSAEDMLQTLQDRNTLLLKELHSVHYLCGQLMDFGTSALIETWIDETERRIWFLFECSQAD